MIGNEAVYEICNELSLLSHYSKKCFDHAALRERVEFASLFARLDVVSRQAEMLLETGQVGLNESEWLKRPNQQTKLSCNEDHESSIQDLPTAPAAKHEWITNVLEDISAYASKNGLDDVSIEMRRVSSFIVTQLHEQNNSLCGITTSGDTSKVISLVSPSRGIL